MGHPPVSPDPRLALQTSLCPGETWGVLADTVPTVFGAVTVLARSGIPAPHKSQPSAVALGAASAPHWGRLPVLWWELMRYCVCRAQKPGRAGQSSRTPFTDGETEAREEKGLGWNGVSRAPTQGSKWKWTWLATLHAVPERCPEIKSTWWSAQDAREESSFGGCPLESLSEHSPLKRVEQPCPDVQRRAPRLRDRRPS